MSLCRYSSEQIDLKTTTIDNVFISEFMPDAPEKCTKVYLYGLLNCANPNALTNELDNFCKQLNLSEDDVISSYIYWQDLGLVQILSDNPFEVRYLPVKSGSKQLKKFNTDKYKDFNIEMQDLVAPRMIQPNEYQEYYYLMESLHMDKDALLVVAQYCVGQKGKNVNYPYIIAVAKNWAYDGILTYEQANERMKELDICSNDLALVLKALGIKRKPSSDEYQMYLSWTKKMEFTLDFIVHVAKKVKKISGAFIKLDNMLEKCYNLRLESVKEVDDYFDNLDKSYEVAKAVCKNLGCRYDNLEIVVDTYISVWQGMGYDNDALVQIANYCFRSSIKTLEGMNSKINSLFKKGVLTTIDINNYLEEILKTDEDIKDVLDSLGLERMVNNNDRALYKIWTTDWLISKEIISYATTLCVGEYFPIQTLNKILSYVHNNKLMTVEEVKKVDFKKIYGTTTKTENKSDKKPQKREYSSKVLDGLFADINEVEI